MNRKMKYLVARLYFGWDRHAAQTVIEVFSIDLDRALGHAAVIHLHQDLTQIAAALRLKDGPAVMAQRKADLRIGERKFLHDIRDQRKLILRRLQMLETRRGTLKQMLDANARSQRTRRPGERRQTYRN